MKPISKNQIEAARALYEKLPDWKESRQSLDALNTQCEGLWSLDVCIWQVAAINSLYSTNLKWLVPVAKHVHRELPQLRKSDPVTLVTKLATYVHQGTRPVRLTSFASKFSHFFVNPDCAIYDKYAAKSIEILRGEKLPDGERCYSSFFDSVEELKRKSKLELYDLDKFLWLAGMYSEVHQTGRAKISGNVRKLFDENQSLAESLKLETR